LSSAPGHNRLTLAVAGAGKTTWIVDECGNELRPDAVLAITYMRTNQRVLAAKLGSLGGQHSLISVVGWYGFLISEIARPFLPAVLPNTRILGFDFHSPPQTGTPNTARRRYLTEEGLVRRVHLAQLCNWILEGFGEPAINRLSRIYSRIYIDEVQDLAGYDLEILKKLFDSPIQLEMVGDVRQAVVSTSERERKNGKYKGLGIWNWFKDQERTGSLEIQQRNETWRCNQEIATFADNLFDEGLEFEPTKSLNLTAHPHSGVWLVRTSEVPDYLRTFSPLFLRDPRSAKNEPYAFTNFRVSKGLECDHVLIWPTGPIKDLLRKGSPLLNGPATNLYVGVTRARHSVGFVLDSPGDSHLPYWNRG